MRPFALALLLTLAGCCPCKNVELCMPSSFTEGAMVDYCGGEEASLVDWWEQFNDPLLTSLIEKALECNYDLRIARERVREARAFQMIEFSQLLPHVDGVLHFDRVRNSTTLADSDFLGARFVNVYRTGFDAIWEFDLFGKNIDRTRGAAYEAIATAEEVRDVHVSIAAEVAANYITLRTLQDRIKITQDHITYETEMLALMQERYDGGLISELDVLLTKSLLESRKGDLPQLQIRLQQAVFALAVLLGEMPEALDYLVCDEGPIPCGDAKIPLGLPTDLLCRRGDLRAAEFNLRAAGAYLLAERKELLPTISLAGLWGQLTGLYTSIPRKGSRNWRIIGDLFQPIFQGGRIVSNISAQTSVQRQAALAYEQSVIQAVEEVESNLVAYFKESERLEALTARVNADLSARSIAQDLYLAGIEDFLNVLITARDLYFSQNLLAESKETQMTALVAVYKALGGGWECSFSP